ncbi:hypothetical protein [Methyloligella halotolerans]|uniref:hypothetical protein n=1 Tax=Methyloligella halotolerans TaxID=1177755 RepID=UPI001471190B|nr:hypothetical protein [Methyloligella halotolerans]
MAALMGYMRLFSFEVIATRKLTSPHRVTLLAKAVKPEEVSDRPYMVERIHDVDFCDLEFLLSRDLSEERSHIVAPRASDGDIDPAKYEPDFPYHPPRGKRTVGTTAWTTPDGNR